MPRILDDDGRERGRGRRRRATGSSQAASVILYKQQHLGSNRQPEPPEHTQTKASVPSRGHPPSPPKFAVQLQVLDSVRRLFLSAIGRRRGRVRLAKIHLDRRRLSVPPSQGRGGNQVFPNRGPTRPKQQPPKKLNSKRCEPQQQSPEQQPQAAHLHRVQLCALFHFTDDVATVTSVTPHPTHTPNSTQSHTPNSSLAFLLQFRTLPAHQILTRHHTKTKSLRL